MAELREKAHTSSPVSGSMIACHGAGSRDMLAMAVSAATVISAAAAAECALTCDTLRSAGATVAATAAAAAAAAAAAGGGAAIDATTVGSAGSSHTISPESVLWKNTSPVASAGEKN